MIDSFNSLKVLKFPIPPRNSFDRTFTKNSKQQYFGLSDKVCCVTIVYISNTVNHSRNMDPTCALNL